MAKRLLEAWTPSDYEGNYPLYVNISKLDKDKCELRIREPYTQNGSVGREIAIVCDLATITKISETISSAVSKFND